jgi:hypothetical protein
MFISVNLDMINKRNSVYLPCTALTAYMSKNLIFIEFDLSEEYKKSDGFFDVEDLYCGKCIGTDKIVHVLD